MQSIKPIGEYFTYIDIDAVNNKVNIIDKAKNILCSQAPSRASRKLEANSILFSMVRPYLRNITMVGEEYKDAIASTGFYVVTPSMLLFTKYIFNLLLSSYVVDGLNQFMKGDNSPSINNEHIEGFLYPVPPVNEQQKIVAEIEKIMPFADKYEESQEALNKLNVEIFDKLKKSVLQEAIQGKLIPQSPDDEPASVLLERIKEEKAKLFKDGKLKKKDLVDSVIFKGDDNKYYEKVGSEINYIDDEIPFEIPSNWQWVRLGKVTIVNPRNTISDEMSVGFIPMTNISPGYGNSIECEQRYWKDVKSGFTHIADGDVAFAKITPCFQNRKSFIAANLPNGFAAGTTELNVLRPYDNTIDTRYLLWFLKSEYFISEAKFKGTAGQQRVVTDYVLNRLFPLPPVKEQIRISNHLEFVIASIMRR